MNDEIRAKRISEKTRVGGEVGDRCASSVVLFETTILPVAVPKIVQLRGEKYAPGGRGWNVVGGLWTSPAPVIVMTVDGR